MLKSKKLIFLSILMCFCMIIFVGCTYSLPYSGKVSRYTTTNQTEQYSVIEDSDLEDLVKDEKKQLIAEKYISISFTVIIYQITESNTNGEVTVEEKQASFGSGFIVHTGGYILTNNHVVESLTYPPLISTGTTNKTISYKCYVSQDGGKTLYEAKLLWSNSRFDMAIIMCEHFADLEAAVLKDRTIYCNAEDKINILEDVITVGTQASLDRYATATSGEITSTILRDAFSSDLAIYEYLIQHNASINHGNSGGALIDLEGNVIGLNTLGDDSANSLFYAVSIYPAIVVLDKVVENYESAKALEQQTGEEGDITTGEITFNFSGVDKYFIKYKDDLIAGNSDYEFLNEIDFSDDGVYVESVENNCIILGLQAGDILVDLTIVTADGTLSFDVKDQYTLLCARLQLLYGQSGNVTVLRNGVETTLTLDI